MTVPKYHELIRPLLDLVADGRPRNLREAAQELAERLSLTDEDLTETLPSGYPRYLKLEKCFGSPHIERRARSKAQRNLDARRADRRDTGRTPGSTRARSPHPASVDQPGKLRALRRPPAGRHGHGVGEVTGRSGDGGIDGVIYEDRLELDRIYLQAKRWADAPVGGPDINGFFGALAKHGANRGVFVTTRRFTQDARPAVELPHLRLVLIDGEELARLAVAHNVGVSVKRKIELKRLDTDFFDDL